MMNDNNSTGQQIYDFVTDLFPILRSITGEGVRHTLREIQVILSNLTIEELPSGKQVFDWTIPDEWNCKEAYIITPDGERICDIDVNNLHLVNYSVPVKKTISLDELQKHLHSLPDMPDAIPYVTSYYKKNWGFCLTELERRSLKEGDYQVVIDSSLESGVLNYGELIIPASDDRVTEEIFISTYVCHPSMANNELSGPGIVTFLAKYISELAYRRYNYRIIFIPETIGAISYLSLHLDEMKKNVVAGFNVSCVGDDDAYSFLPSRNGQTISDKVAKHVLKHMTDDQYLRYSFLERGSDERQYCSPGADLPIASICRSKYAEYKEYHTSLDNLDYVSPEGFQGAYNAYTKSIEILEANKRYVATNICEPQLGKYGLYGKTLENGIVLDARMMLHILTYADGHHDLIDIAEIVSLPVWHIMPYIEALVEAELIKESTSS